MVDVDVLCHHFNQKKAMEIVFTLLFWLFVLLFILMAVALFVSAFKNRFDDIERTHRDLMMCEYPFSPHTLHGVGILSKQFPHPIWKEFRHSKYTYPQAITLLKMCSELGKCKMEGKDEAIPILLDAFHEEYKSIKK